MKKSRGFLHNPSWRLPSQKRSLLIHLFLEEVDREVLKVGRGFNFILLLEMQSTLK